MILLSRAFLAQCDFVFFVVPILRLFAHRGPNTITSSNVLRCRLLNEGHGLMSRSISAEGILAQSLVKSWRGQSGAGR